MAIPIEIDKNSGFCFGVIKAIDKAQEILKKENKLFCLGEIVHNQSEVERLEKLGLITINHEQFRKLKNCKVLIRAHGEPPETYQTAKENNIEIIDASCPVVLKLQERIKLKYSDIQSKDGQLVIYGKEGHAEVKGLVGHTKNKAIIIKETRDLDKIDFNKPIRLFSQTTMSKAGFEEIKEEIFIRLNQCHKGEKIDFEAKNTVCGQVSCREPALTEFSKKHDIILFVSGKNSSNGKMLYELCKSHNANSYFVSSEQDLEKKWFENINSVGVCGATSTPLWLMQDVVHAVKGIIA